MHPLPVSLHTFRNQFLAGFAALALAACVQAQAPTVALAGMMGTKALLVVNGNAKPVGAGETYQGFKVIYTKGDLAVVEQDGKRFSLRVGDAPVASGGPGPAGGRSNKIVLTAGSGGHFMTPGQINGRAVQFMVDTGATAIAMSASDAERAGVAFKQGQPIRINTANGVSQGYQIKLASVRIGDVEVYGVDAVVTQQPMPFMLLGNSFLTRFQMVRENDQMTLVKRY